MKKSMWISILLLWSVAGYAVDTNFEFKGLILGGITTPSQITEQLSACPKTGKPCSDSARAESDASAVTCGLGANNMQVCNGQTTIAHESAQVNAVIDANGLLQRVMLTIDQSSYEVVRDELLKKYGKPSSTNETELQNGFGATFAQVDTVWTRPGGQVLRLLRYGGSTEESTIYFGTKSDVKLLAHDEDRSDDL
ncbi:MAG TPA: hypothetical protein VGM16_03165 [Gammaproteobacteria bacterium]|jgi:hypothetical protein